MNSGYTLILAEANVSKELLVETVTRVTRWNWQKPGQLIGKSLERLVESY